MCGSQGREGHTLIFDDTVTHEAWNAVCTGPD
jgi:hypothetical protein